MESIFSNSFIHSLLYFLLIIMLIVFYNQNKKKNQDINQLLNICDNKLVWILIPFIIYSSCIYLSK